MFNWRLVNVFSTVLGVVCVATVGEVDLALAQSTPPHIARLGQWLEAVNDHEAGEWDASAETVASWSTTELESLFPYVKALVELVGQGEIKPGWGVFSGVEMELLKNMAPRARRSDINTVMKRGALLHSDIAIIAQADNATTDSPYSALLRANRIGPRFRIPHRRTVVSDDGRFQTVGREAIHWEFGRMLLDAVRPSPSLNAGVRLWYEAIAAYFAGKYLLAQALHHLDRAEQLFPNDPELLFDRGCLHETFAAPRVQRVIETTDLRDGGRITVAGVSANLRDAERYFRRALDRNPGMTEARVRLARVLVLRGRPEQARTELHRTIAAAKDSVLVYYSQLFLAGAEEALGKFDAGHEAYMKAAELYPRAQSPRLGLSLLARRQGDRPAALRAIQQVLSLPADERARDDPWWRYDAGAGPNADALLAAMRTRFGERRE